MFETKFGSTNCRELVQVDLDTEAGQNEFKVNNTVEDCYHYAEAVTEMTLSLLENV